VRDLFLKKSRPVPGPNKHPVQCVRVDSVPGVKRPGCEANHSPPSSAPPKNEGPYTSTPPTCLHGVYRDNFTFYIFINTNDVTCVCI
jgi:hypothetical protein